MEPFTALIILFGVMYGAKRAAEDATAATRRLFTGGGHSGAVGRGGSAAGGRGHAGAAGRAGGHGGHSTRVATTAGGGRGHGTGRRVAIGTGAVVAGAGTIGREFAAGWRRGYPEGKERARTRFGGHVATEPAHDGTRPTTKCCDAEMDPQDWLNGKPCPKCGNTGPNFDRPAPNPPPGPLLNDTTHTPPKGHPMTTTHTTEITSMDDYERAREADIKRSADEVDDAQTGLQRAEEDVQRIDEESAALAGMEVDQATIGELSAIGDAIEARRSAHQMLLHAAEREHAANVAALEGVRGRHGAIKEHADVVANRQFYTGG
jgi:hypothetical protein